MEFNLGLLLLLQAILSDCGPCSLFRFNKHNASGLDDSFSFGFLMSCHLYTVLNSKNTHMSHLSTTTNRLCFLLSCTS